MSRVLHRLGGFAARHPWRVIGAWLAAAVVVLGLAGSVGGALNDDYVIPGTSSQRAYDLLQDKFPAFAGADARVVVHTDNGTLDHGRPRRNPAAAVGHGRPRLAGRAARRQPGRRHRGDHRAVRRAGDRLQGRQRHGPARGRRSQPHPAGLPGRARRPDAGEHQQARRHGRDGRHRPGAADPVPGLRLVRGRRPADRRRAGRPRDRLRRRHPAGRADRRHDHRAHARLDDRDRRRRRLRPVHRHPAPGRAGPRPVGAGRGRRGHRDRRAVGLLRRGHRAAGAVRPALHRRTELPGHGLRPGSRRAAHRGRLGHPAAGAARPGRDAGLQPQGPPHRAPRGGRVALADRRPAGARGGREAGGLDGRLDGAAARARGAGPGHEAGQRRRGQRGRVDHDPPGLRPGRPTASARVPTRRCWSRWTSTRSAAPPASTR